ncbi:hypothetical protein U724_03495 [Pseudomonas chlororaphis subsp. aurantiaca PB-St2]|nr:hypothetical protein U724_03495 [Pseudomonas chlororaphis subsp. aurantiaca PB-St2]
MYLSIPEQGESNGFDTFALEILGLAVRGLSGFLRLARDSHDRWQMSWPLKRSGLPETLD